MENSTVIPTTTTFNWLAIGSVTKRELMTSFLCQLSQWIWMFVISIITVFFTTYERIFEGGDDEGVAPLFKGSIVGAVFILVQLIVKLCFVLLLQNGRADIVRAWHRNKIVMILTLTCGANSYFESIERADSSVIRPVDTIIPVGDSSAKRDELMEEYRSTFRFSVGMLLVPLSAVGLLGLCLLHGKDVASAFVLAVALTGINVIVVIGKYCLMYLVGIGREDIVWPLSRNPVVMLLFHTMHANAVFQRIRDEAVASPSHDIAYQV